jgi:nucleotide-binding universal stress UspA family protein
MNAYRRILAALDGSEASARGLREALRLAKTEGAQLWVVHVVNERYPYAPLVGAPPIDLIPALMQDGRRILDEAVALAAEQGVQATPVLLSSPEHSAADSIVEEARKQQADLIVLGTHGRRGLARLVLGSDAELVVRHATVPVLLVRAPD